MKDKITDFQKTKDFLVCVDSDGCAMDTMDVKHIEGIRSRGCKYLESSSY